MRKFYSRGLSLRSGLVRYSLLGFAWLSYLVANAQNNPANYRFNIINQNYTELNASADVEVKSGSTDDDIWYVGPGLQGVTPQTGPGYPIGFNFLFGINSFTHFGVNSNGYIILGSASPATYTGTYGRAGTLALKDPNAYGPNLIAPWVTDLQLQASSRISYQLLGTAPNRNLTIQYKGLRHYAGTGEDLNFQIQLFEGSNEIIMLYGNMLSTSTGRVIQIGLKGADSSEVSSLDIPPAAGFASATRSNFAQTAFTTAGNFVPTSGQGYKWAPPRPPVPNDIGVLSITGPGQDPNSCPQSANTQVRVRIFNYGTNAISGSDVAYRVNGGPEVLQNFTFNPPISPTQSRVVTFTTGFNATAVGTYRLSAYTKLANDTADDNDSAKNSIRVDNGKLLPLDPANTLASGQSIGWRRLSGIGRPLIPTPNTFSGWVADFTIFNNEAYSVELSSTLDSAQAWFVSPKVEVTENAYLAFRLKAQALFGGRLSRMGRRDTLKVMASYDCGQSWGSLKNYTRLDFGTPTGIGNNEFINQEVPLSTTPGQSVIAALYLARWDTSGVSYEMVADSAIIFVKPANDMGVSRAITPNSSTNDYCNLTANETISFEIKNTGLLPRTTADVGFRIDNDAVVTQTVNFNPPLTIGQTQIVSFPNVNLANRINFRLRVFVKSPLDAVIKNDTLDQRFTLVDRTPVRLRYGTNFDTTNFGLPQEWTNLDANPGISSGHGTGSPASNGMSVNLYSSIPRATQNIRPVGPVVDSFSTLTFDYRLMNWSAFFANPTPFNVGAGDSIVFWVTTDCGVNWDKLYKISASNHQTSSQFTEVKVNLKKYVGRTLAIQWRGYWGQAPSDFYFDFDNFMVERNPERDLALRNLISPSRLNINCGYTNAEPVIAEVRNNGRVNITTFDGSYRINNGSWVNETFNLPTPLGPGDVTRITFNQTANISAGGTYRFNLKIAYLADSAAFNDTLSSVILNAAPAPVPNRVIFDTVRGDLPRFWNTQNAADVFVQFGHGKNGRDGLGVFLPTGNQVRSVTTAVYGLTSTTNIGAKFIYRIAKSANFPNDVHILGPNDSIKIDVSTNCGVTWLERMVIKAANQNRSINFDSIAVPANVPVGSKLMYRVIVTSSTGDFYLDFDEFKLVDIPGVDLTMGGIFKPNNNYPNCTPSSTEPVEVVIVNQGANPSSNATVTIRLNGAFAFSQNLSFNPPIAPGTARIVALNQTVNISTAGNYLVSARVSATGDVNVENDSARTTVNVFGQVSTFPNVNNLSDPALGWQVAAGNSNASWEHIQGTSTLGAGASPPRISPSVGIGMYVFAAHEFPSGAVARLNTRCFDFSGITAGGGDTLNLQFAYSKTGNISPNVDSLILSYTTNGGASYTQLGAYSRLDPTLGTGGAAWTPVTLNISNLAGLSGVRFSFEGRGKGGNAIAIDYMNVRVSSNNAFIQFAHIANPQMVSGGNITNIYDSVDVYINNVKVADNLPYRNSTAFLKRAPGVYRMHIFSKNSTDTTGPGLIWRNANPLVTVKDRYYVVTLMGGGLNSLGNPRNPVFTANILSNARFTSVQANEVDMNFIHGVVDDGSLRFTQVGPNFARVALSNSNGVGYPSASAAYSSLPAQALPFEIGESGSAVGSPIVWRYVFDASSLGNQAIIFYLNGMNNVRSASSTYEKALCYSRTIGGPMTCLPKLTSLAPRISMDFDVYPNPSTGIFGLSTRFSGLVNSRVEVVNLLGQVVYTEDLGMISDSNRELNLSHLKAGSYMVRLIQGDVMDFRQVVIQK